MSVRKRFRRWCHYWICFNRLVDVRHADGRVTIACECGRIF